MPVEVKAVQTAIFRGSYKARQVVVREGLNSIPLALPGWVQQAQRSQSGAVKTTETRTPRTTCTEYRCTRRTKGNDKRGSDVRISLHSCSSEPHSKSSEALPA